ncbi:mmpL11, partial [Symbiodinium sp. KB8]
PRGLRECSVRTLDWYRSVTVLAVSACLLCAAPRIVDTLFSKTHAVGWQTPKESPALKAGGEIQQLFPRRVAGTIVMGIEASDQTASVTSPEVEAFSRNVSRQVESDERVSEYKPIVLGYYLDPLPSLPESIFPKADLLSADRRMTYLLIQPTQIPENHDFRKANEFLQEFCSSPPPGYELHITGMPAIATGSGCSSSRHSVMNPTDMSFRSLFYAEMISLPIALLIMGLLIRYQRLLVLPLITVGVAFVVSALLLLPWMDYVEVPPDGIAAMGSVILALSLDYSLFVLSRFGENKVERLTLQQNVDIIKEQTCWTVTVSGILVAIAFFSGVLLPEKNLQGTVVCLGFAVLACVLTNVVLLPAVFLVFGDFLVGTSFMPAVFGDAELSSAVEDVDTGETSPADKEKDSQFWLFMMRAVEVAPLVSSVAVVALLWPILSSAPSLHITADRFAMMPLESPAVLALRRIQDRFPMGILAPFEILISAPEQPEDLVLTSELKGVLTAVGDRDLRPALAALGPEAQEFFEALQPPSLPGPETTTQAPASFAATFNHLMESAQCLGRYNVTNFKRPDCRCCPNALVDCRRCDFERLCQSSEAQASLQRLEKNVSAVAGSSDLQQLMAADARTLLGTCMRLAKDLDLTASELDRASQELWSAAARSPQVSQLLASEDAGNSSLPQMLDKLTQPGSQLLQKYPFIQDVVQHLQAMSDRQHGMLLLPSGFLALLDLCDALHRTESISSMLGPSWAYYQRVDWIAALMAATNPGMRDSYNLYMQQFVNGRHALLQIHTIFPSIGAGGADWAASVRHLLSDWEAAHPGFRAQLAGGNAEALDTRAEILTAMWPYLALTVTLIMAVVYLSFQSLLVPLRLALALCFTLVGTFGMGVIVYQTTLLHGLCPHLQHFYGITYEVIPLVTGIAIALGLDYDIFLVSRILEFRLQRYSDRASIFRGVLKTGDVISGAGLIMSLAFSGLVVSDKIFFQQFGVLIITSVLLDTFVVRTVLVPALMLTAQEWNWWPRTMPSAIHDVLE